MIVRNPKHTKRLPPTIYEYTCRVTMNRPQPHTPAPYFGPSLCFHGPVLGPDSMVRPNGTARGLPNGTDRREIRSFRNYSKRVEPSDTNSPLTKNPPRNQGRGRGMSPTNNSIAQRKSGKGTHTFLGDVVALVAWEDHSLPG